MIDRLFDWGQKSAAPPAGYSYGPHYRPSLLNVIRGIVAVALGRPRSLGRDALLVLHDLPEPPILRGLDNLPEAGPIVLVANHYERPGLWMAWPTLVIASAVCERTGHDTRWVAIREWESFAVAGIPIPAAVTRALFERTFRVYGIVAMAPPAAPSRERAASMRAVRDIVQKGGIVGIMPEGDVGLTPELLPVREGVGAFLHMLAHAGATTVPVGLYEESGRLVVSVGSPLELRVAGGREDRDQRVRAQVMGAIRDLLPEALWGVWREETRAL